MAGLEIGRIEGFPEVSISQPLGLFDDIPVNADFKLAVYCPKFPDDQVLAQFRYALASALSPALGVVHGFQVQHQGSQAATRQVYGGRVHEFTITRAGLISLGVENQLLDFKKQKSGEFSLAFTATDTMLNPEFLKACMSVVGSLAIGGMRELSWTKGNMKGNYEGILTGLSI